MTASLKAVIQEDLTGCAIACTAALAKVSYASAKRAAASLGIRPEDPRLWSDSSHVHRLLKHYKIRMAQRRRPFRSWTRLPERALLATKWHREKGRPFWHWVVYVRTADSAFVLDSKKALRRHRRTDFGRIKPKWFWRLQGS